MRPLKGQLPGEAWLTKLKQNSLQTPGMPTIAF